MLEDLFCIALSYVLYPRGTSDLLKRKKRLNFQDVFNSETSDDKNCLSLIDFQSFIFKVGEYNEKTLKTYVLKQAFTFRDPRRRNLLF